MDFSENHFGGGVTSEAEWTNEYHREWAGDSYMHNADGAVSQTIARAIRDATQTTDPARQQEAAAWLRICCPDIAEQVELPELHYDAISTLATSYVTG